MRRAAPPLGALAILIGIWAFVSLMLTIVVALGIWPGEAKLTAPIVCPDDKPDAFVVSDRYQPAPGETTTTYTMYCMGPTGSWSNEGFFRPIAILALAHGLLLALFVVIPFIIWSGRRLTRRGPPSNPTDAVG